MPEETKPSYSPGLAGVVAGETAICWVDPNAGLMYRGYDIHELATEVAFEEIVWLLLMGDLPNASELALARQNLESERSLPGPVVDMLRLLPPNTHPIDALRTAVSMLGAFDPELTDNSREANLRKSWRLIAKVPTIVSDSWRILQGEPLIPERKGLSHAANFYYRLTGQEPESWKTQALDTILALYADHEFNASTFSARVTASTLADLYAAATTAIGTLKGPLHGGANEDAIHLLEEIGSPEKAEARIKDKLAKKEKITGFGHRVYKKGDSRVPAMRAILVDLGKRYGKEHWAPICQKLEDVMEREKQLCCNVDLYAAPVFALLGIPSVLNTPIFAVARVAGWCAHVIEQHGNNRLIRPRSIYTGPSLKPFARKKH
jgi:2-methylcitrate synthase/citrate synthase II